MFWPKLKYGWATSSSHMQTTAHSPSFVNSALVRRVSSDDIFSSFCRYFLYCCSSVFSNEMRSIVFLRTVCILRFTWPMRYSGSTSRNTSSSEMVAILRTVTRLTRSPCRSSISSNNAPKFFSLSSGFSRMPEQMMPMRYFWRAISCSRRISRSAVEMAILVASAAALENCECMRKVCVIMIT